MKMNIPDDKDLLILAVRYLRYIAYTCMYYRRELEKPGEYRRRMAGLRQRYGKDFSSPVGYPTCPELQALPWEEDFELPGDYDLARYFTESGLWSKLPDGIYWGWPWGNLEELEAEEEEAAEPPEAAPGKAGNDGKGRERS